MFPFLMNCRERDQSLRPIIIIILIIITIHIFGGIQVLNVCQGSTQSRNAYGKIEVYLVVAMLLRVGYCWGK